MDYRAVPFLALFFFMKHEVLKGAAVICDLNLQLGTVLSPLLWQVLSCELTGLDYLSMAGHLPVSMLLEGCGAAQSYMTVVSGLVFVMFPFFLEFRAPCLPQVYLCSWVCTPVIISKCSGIAQRGCVGLQIMVGFTDKALWYSCLPQTIHGGSVSSPELLWWLEKSAGAKGNLLSLCHFQVQLMRFPEKLTYLCW